jgi:hypothetical protein
MLACCLWRFALCQRLQALGPDVEVGFRVAAEFLVHGAFQVKVDMPDGGFEILGNAWLVQKHARDPTLAPKRGCRFGGEA